MFQSGAVNLQWNRNNLILSRGTSQLLIKAEDVQTLRSLSGEKEFEEFFRSKALVNREARRVFEAWERKDDALIPKLHKEVIS